MLANLTSGEGHTDSGVLCLTVAIGGVLALRFGQEQGENCISVQNPYLCHLGAFVAGIVVAGICSNLMIDQVCFLILPGRLNADAVVGCANGGADGGLVLYGGPVRFEGIRSAVGVCHRMPQQAGKVNLTGAGIGHRVPSVQGVCCLIQGGEGVQVLLLGCGDGGKHRGFLVFDRIVPGRQGISDHPSRQFPNRPSQRGGGRSRPHPSGHRAPDPPASGGTVPPDRRHSDRGIGTGGES